MFRTTSNKYLPVSAHGAVDGRAFLGLAEERVVWVAAPQLLARVEGPVLREGTETEGIQQTPAAAPLHRRRSTIQHAGVRRRPGTTPQPSLTPYRAHAHGRYSSIESCSRAR